MLEVLIVAALLGLVVGAIAQSKGRSFFGWWLYGALLFIVAIVHVLVLKPDVKGVEARALQGGDQRKCPHCAEVIKAEAKVCRYCGRDVEPVAQASLARAPAADYLG